MALAWHVAALMRAKKLPRLSSLLKKERNRAQTPDQILAMIRMINAMHGGTVIEKGKADGR